MHLNTLPARLACGVVALLVVSPIAALLWHAVGADFAHWSHLAANVLPVAARNTLWLLVGVGVLVTLVGTGAAWLVTAYQFPGRGVLVWALLLPMAMPLPGNW